MSSRGFSHHEETGPPSSTVLCIPYLTLPLSLRVQRARGADHEGFDHLSGGGEVAGQGRIRVSYGQVQYSYDYPTLLYPTLVVVYPSHSLPYPTLATSHLSVVKVAATGSVVSTTSEGIIIPGAWNHGSTCSRKDSKLSARIASQSSCLSFGRRPRGRVRT